MKPFFRILILAFIVFPPASIQATDHECTASESTTCLPEDPESVFECFGDSGTGWGATIWCRGIGVCCQLEPAGNAGCCCRQLDCEIGSKRCFGDDMVQECQKHDLHQIDECIEWVPVTWCLELGPNYRCQDAQCIEVIPDGDSADCDDDEDVPVMDGDLEPDIESLDGDHDDDQPETDSDRIDSQNSKKTVVSNKNSGCRTTDDPKGICFLIWVFTWAILNRNKTSDYLNS